MANNYTQASFTIPVHRNRLRWLWTRLRMLRTRMSWKVITYCPKPASGVPSLNCWSWVLFRTTRSAIRLSRLLVSQITRRQLRAELKAEITGSGLTSAMM